MPTIRDLVSALRLREGVDAAMVLGRDGLLIDGATEMGVAAGRGDFRPVLLRSDANLAAPLDDLGRFRAQIASLV